MEGHRILCPICSVRVRLPEIKAFRCPKCGRRIEAEWIDATVRTLGEVIPKQGESNDALFKRTLAALSRSGVRADPPEALNQMFGADRPFRVLALEAGATGPALVVMVNAVEWTPDLFSKAAAALLHLTNSLEVESESGWSRFHLVASQPLPERIRYPFAHTKQGRFERLAVVMLRILDENQAVEPEQIEPILKIGKLLSQACFGWEPTLKDKKEIAKIDELILKEFREPHPEDKELSEDEVYVPVTSMLALGAMAGEILMSQEGFKGRWEPMQGNSFHLALNLHRPEKPENPAQINLIGKAIKCYLNGKQDCVTFLTGLALSRLAH